MKTVVAKLCHNELRLVSVAPKYLEILDELTSGKKIKRKAFMIRRTFMRVFKTEDVLLNEENCFLFTVSLNGVLSDYYLLKIDENSSYIYYLNNKNKLVFFNDDESCFLTYLQETNFKLFNLKKVSI